MSKSALVIGAGIVGLATARALAIRGYKVTVLEKNEKAVGASIRNFGMIWPIGQPHGSLYERAILSKNIWKQITTEANIWKDEAGSLHVAHNLLEQQVLEQCRDSFKERGYSLLTKAASLQKTNALVEEGLQCALYSSDEMIVDPREAIGKMPVFLHEKYGVSFLWSSTVTKIFYPTVWVGKKSWDADEIYICNGADFETLFPEQFNALPITRCKLQMMKLKEQPSSWRIGPALCGGLSLIHYKSFEISPTLSQLRNHFKKEREEYLKWGIHVMVAQNQSGELIVGDSHEYGHTHDPFTKMFINKMILNYLKGFARFKNEDVVEYWNGIYPKLTDGRTEIILHPQPGVTIINGLGGAGMTLSFGLCEQVIGGTYTASLVTTRV